MDLSDDAREEETTLSPSNSIVDTGDLNARKRAAYLILASTLFERVAFYTISANFVSASLTFHWTSTHSLIASFIFSGLSYVSTLMFAVICDAKVRRLTTIFFGFCLYLIGYIWAILIVKNNTGICDTHPSDSSASIFQESCFSGIFPTLAIIALASGAIQSNMPVFGIEQLDKSEVNIRYFDKHVIIVNISAIIAKMTISLIVDIDQKSLYIGYIIAAICLFIAVLILVFGRKHFIHGKPYDSVLTNCFPVIRDAYHNWRDYRKNRDSMRVQTDLLSVSISPSTANDDDDMLMADDLQISFLDFAKVRNHGHFQERIVNDVKSLRSALIVFSLLIPYWFIYDQLNTSFPSQRQYMDNPFNQTYPLTSSTVISFGDSLTIIIGLLIFNVFVYKYLDARNRFLSMQTRFIIGLFLAFITMMIAGSVEVSRQGQCQEHMNTSSLSIFVQLPQNICLGLSELFIMAASFEFSYYASRRSAHSLFMSLRFCSIGISSFLSSSYMAAFSSTNLVLDFSCNTPPKSPWTQYSYFYILGVIQLFFIIFILCRKQFRIIRQSLRHVDDNPITD